MCHTLFLKRESSELSRVLPLSSEAVKDIGGRWLFDERTSKAKDKEQVQESLFFFPQERLLWYDL